MHKRWQSGRSAAAWSRRAAGAVGLIGLWALVALGHAGPRRGEPAAQPGAGAPAEPARAPEPAGAPEPTRSDSGQGLGGWILILGGALLGAAGGGYVMRRWVLGSAATQRAVMDRLVALEGKVRGVALAGAAPPVGSAPNAPAATAADSAALEELSRRLSALESTQGDVERLCRAATATAAAERPPQRLCNPGMGPDETALLAVVNRAWERGAVDRAELLRMAEEIGLVARFFALRNIDKTLQTLWDDTFTFLPSDDEGGWLMYEAPDGTVRAVPADPAFFRFAGVMTLVRRMFEGVPQQAGAAGDPRFVRAYRGALLQRGEGGRYKLTERGTLLCGGGADPGLPRPVVWEALRSAAGGGRGGKGPKTLADLLGDLQGQIEGLRRELGEVQRLGLQAAPAAAPTALSDRDLARLAVALARLAAKSNGNSGSHTS